MMKAMTETNPTSLIRIARENGTEDHGEPLVLGARVRELRKERDWTLEQAAKKAGLARSTLSKIENGQMSPTYDALKKLATGLGIPVPQLFTPPKAAQITSDSPIRIQREASSPPPNRPKLMPVFSP